MSIDLLRDRIIEIVRDEDDLARAVAAVDPLIEMLKQEGHPDGDELFELWWDAEQVNSIYLGEHRPPTDDEANHVQARLSEIAERLEKQRPSRDS